MGCGVWILFDIRFGVWKLFDIRFGVWILFDIRCGVWILFDIRFGVWILFDIRCGVWILFDIRFGAWLITRFVTRLTRGVSLVEQELLTLPEHLSSAPVFSGVRVTRSLVLYVCFVDRCLSFCTFSFGHCAVCSYSIYGFWLPL